MGEDRRIERYEKLCDQLVRRRVFPASSAFKKNLYRYPRLGMDEWSAQAAEWAVFQTIDHCGAKALDALLNDRDAIRHGEVRHHWAVFLRTILMRTPYQMQGVIASLEKIWSETDVSAKYESMRKEGMPETAREFLEGLNPNVAKESAFRLFVDAIGRDDITTHLTNLPWRIIDCSSASHLLLLSDHPVVVVPLRSEIGHIAMPLSSSKVLVAAGNESVRLSVDAMTAQQVVRTLNKLTVRRAVDCVIAQDRSQEAFITKHFGVEQIPPFLSPEKLR